MALALQNRAELDPETQRVYDLIDAARTAMDGEMTSVRARCRTYLNWYSPPFEERLGTHDAWTDPFLASAVDLTRANFPIARAVVDIWTALEAAKPATLWSQPERVAPAPPSLDQATELQGRLLTSAIKKYRAYEAQFRANVIRDWMRLDDFALKSYLAVKRKNLYGFSWMKVWPHPTEKRPVSHTLRNPTTVYPLWSSREPGELEGILVAYQKSAIRANAEFKLGLNVGSAGSGSNGRVILGQDSGRYQDVNDRWYNQSRTMVWVEEYWWREQEFDDDGFVTNSRVRCVVRVTDKIVKQQTYEGWRLLPWVYWENSDERDSFGWSDIANVIDINDEFNRRLSQEGDIIGSYSAPRFQLLNSTFGRDVEMPGPFELIALQDTERIEQILARVDVYPTQQHFQILTDLLHRVSGLPPITWGLISNAQTSGRALSASWKATEARLAPKLLRNERSHDDYLALVLQYAEQYNWKDAKALFRAGDGSRFRDLRWDFPPMEPRDFMEVTQNEITKRDAGFTTTLKGIRATGDEAAEDTYEETLAEALNIFSHPDKVQAFLLAQRAELDNISYAQQLGVTIAPGGGFGGDVNPVSIASAVGLARQNQDQNQPPAGGAPAPAGAAPGGAAPPPGAPAPAPGGAPPGAAAGSAGAVPGETLTSGTLVRNGQVSNQTLQTRRY